MTESVQTQIEGFATETDIEESNINSLIVVKQTPIIEEQLQKIKGVIEERVEYALSLDCTEDNKQEIKKLRSELNKQYNELETARKGVKATVLEPYNKFEATYKDCITNIFKPADAQLKEKIDDVENAQKEQKRQTAVSYFNEYAQANNIDFLTFEDTGIAVTLSISEKKLKDECKKFIDRVTGDIALIDTQEHKDEIFVEYKKDLDVSKAITSIKRRYEAIEAERKRREEAEARAKAETERQRTVDEAVERHQAEEAENAPEAAPVSAPIEEVEPAEKLYNVSFDFSKRLRLLNVSRAQAVRTRQELNDKINSFINKYLSEEGIEYEYIQSANS